MLIPCCKITIGGMVMNSVNEVTIKRSVYELAATASIKVPVTAVLKRKGDPPAYTETARQIRVGNPVEIQLGYNGAYRVEFRGYVKVVNLQTPLEIVCEDEFYQTRQKSVTLQGEDTLEGILGKCGLNVAYAAKLTIEDFPADNKPMSWVLGKLKSDYGLSMFFDLDGRLYASEPGKVVAERVKYRLRENVIDDDELKFHRADDVKIKIKAICIYRDGSKIEASIGANDGTEKTLYFYDVKDQSELAALAGAELKRHSYDGYRGRIETFLQPFAIPCMVAEVEDPVYGERNGSYFIESVETKLGTGGGRRTVEIGVKI